MKKGIKFYAPCWAIVLIVFNVITFAVPITVNVNKFTPSFWIGYAFITLIFIAQLVCSIVFFKQDSKEKRFLNIPVISLSYTALLVSIIVGAVAMVVPFMPYWVGIILDMLIVAFYAITIIASKAAADTIENIDNKVKAQTFFIKSLTVDAERLLPRAKSDETKAIAKKVYEAIRYSDPMSNEALSSVESQIAIKFNDFSNAVIEDNKPTAKAIGNELIILVNDRNTKCKLSK